MIRILAILLAAAAALPGRAEGTNTPAANAIHATNAVPSAAPAPAEAPRPDSFEAFKIIAQRNIFDPNRSAPGRAPRVREEAPKPVRIDFLTLLGSMSYEKGQFAFFDGTRPEYRKSVKAGDSIAGYKVAAVLPNEVSLEAEGKTVSVPVGAQLKRLDDGEWKLNAVVESFGGASPSPETPSSSGSSSTETKTDSSGGESDALKRMLMRRQQEK